MVKLLRRILMTIREEWLAGRRADVARELACLDKLERRRAEVETENAIDRVAGWGDCL